MIIRKATKKDLSILLKQYIEYQKEEEKLAKTMAGRQKLDPKVIIKDLQSFLLNKNKILLVAIEEEKIIGFLVGRFIKALNQKISNIGSIDELYVIPRNRGQGVSSKLKDEFISWFKNKKKGRGTISLYSMPKNKNAQKAYEKWGFKVSYLKWNKELK
jgi:ribosomal protein S18 acetylase RimI-like enzyme